MPGPRAELFENGAGSPGSVGIFDHAFWDQGLSQRRALARHGGLAKRRLLVLFGGVDDHLTLRAHALAGGAPPRLLFEHEVNDAALAGTHGVEAKWLASFTNALGSDPGRKLQLLDAQGAIATGIKAHVVVEVGIEAEPAQGNVFERLKQLGVSLKQQILIAPAENHFDFGTFNSVFSSDGIAKTNLVGQLEPGRGERQIEKAAQLSGERYAVNLSVLDKWL